MMENVQVYVLLFVIYRKSDQKSNERMTREQ